LVAYRDKKVVGVFVRFRAPLQSDRTNFELFYQFSMDIETEFRLKVSGREYPSGRTGYQNAGLLATWPRDTMPYRMRHLARYPF
jgi:hypothetical protein